MSNYNNQKLLSNKLELRERMSNRTLKADLRDETFALEYVNNGMNGLQAYKSLKPNVKDSSASVRASELIQKSKVRKRIEELLPSEEEDSKVIKSALRTPSPEVIPWKAKLQAVQLSLKGKGYLGEQRNTDIKIGLVVQR